MDETEGLRSARAMRRAMLGDAYVDAQTADANPAMGEFQDYITSMAWGVWAREGALSTRDRSLLVLAMTAALGHSSTTRRPSPSGRSVGRSSGRISHSTPTRSLGGWTV